MRSHRLQSWILTVGFAGLIMWIVPGPAAAQNGENSSGSSSEAAPRDDVKALKELVLQLQSQVASLSARVKTLEANEKNAIPESQSLRAEWNRAKRGAAALPQKSAYSTPEVAPIANENRTASASAAAPGDKPQDTGDLIARLEEDLDLANSKMKEQSQTKVESSSKYRVRLSGLALFNLFANRGTVDDQDFPEIAVRKGLLNSSDSFGGSLRQSQIGLEGFGPDIGGAHTSGEIRFDFAGGFPQTPNGNLMGLVRLRTGTVRLDWTNTSIVAGQDFLFFSPLTPTSFASLATPALSYAGNLWGWTPQVRVEHRLRVSEGSTIQLQGGILESLSGDVPGEGYARAATVGEQSGQPAYAARVAWSHPAFCQNIVAGVGGYYGHQAWGFGRNVDSWAGTADLTVPLGQFVEFTGQFYRGEAVGGLAGGIGQSVLWNGQLTNPATELYGLDSLGGWVQVKLKPTVKFEINGAFGDDNPFSSKLRRFSGNPLYASGLLSRNLVSFVNVIYRPRSDVIFSLEYKRLKTFTLDSNANTANHINLSIGYIF